MPGAADVLRATGTPQAPPKVAPKARPEGVPEALPKGPAYPRPSGCPVRRRSPGRSARPDVGPAASRRRSRRPPDHPTVEGSRWAEPAAELEPSAGPTRRRPSVAQGFGRVSEPRSSPCRVRPVDDAARVDGPGLGRTSCWRHPPGFTGSIPPDASGPALRRASGLGILHFAPTTTARRLFVYTRIRPGARIRVSPA